MSLVLLHLSATPALHYTHYHKWKIMYSPIKVQHGTTSMQPETYSLENSAIINVHVVHTCRVQAVNMNQALFNCEKPNRGVVLHESTLCASCFFLYWATVLTSMSAHYTKRRRMMMMLAHTLPNTNSLTLICHKAKMNRVIQLFCVGFLEKCIHWNFSVRFSLDSNYFKSTKDDLGYGKSSEK